MDDIRQSPQIGENRVPRQDAAIYSLWERYSELMTYLRETSCLNGTGHISRQLNS